jgi:DNA primase
MEQISFQRIKDKIDIIDLFKSYGVVFTGRVIEDEHFAYCPMHEDVIGELKVNSRKKVFYCHGCRSFSGGLIQFIQKMEEVSYKEAKRLLAERTKQKKGGERW